jgi:hypothetical protein
MPNHQIKVIVTCVGLHNMNLIKILILSFKKNGLPAPFCEGIKGVSQGPPDT